jgi:thiamine pyrophosphate-dependent acetolactate synthase large subunit-like protein
MAEMSGKQAMMEQLVAEGVRYVFGNPGTTEQPFMDILQDYPQMQYVLALQEATAVGMADAYAWASDRPAFVQLHVAPGLGNAMGMLYNAYYAGTPLVVYAGQHEPRGVIQEIILAGDLVSMARPVTKWSVEVQDAADIPTVLRRAFKTAAEPPRGPVFISTPLNVMDQTAEMTIAPATYSRWRTRPDPHALAEAADVLAAAQSPVIVCGDGLALSGAFDEAVHLAELVGAQVYSSFSAQLVFPTDHPLYHGLVNIIREVGLRSQLAGADVVLILGAPAFRVIYPMPESPFLADTRVIQIDTNPWELAKNWPAALSIVADPQMALRDLLQVLPSKLSEAARQAAATRLQAARQQKEQALESFEAAARSTWDAVPITAPRLMKGLADCLEPGTIVYDEAITASVHLSHYLKFNQPGTYFACPGPGLGSGLPGALGVKLARPDSPVLAVVGDGAALYTIQALWTAAHHRIPVTYVICNNQSYRILKLNMLQYLGEAMAGRKFVGMDLVDPVLDFAQIAQAFGIRGQRVERPEELGPALRSALRSGEPSLVDVVIEGGLRRGPRGPQAASA